MKKYNLIKIRRLFLSGLVNPLFIFVYAIAFYELYTLCQFGRMNNNIVILLVCILFFLVWFVILIIRFLKKSITVPRQVVDKYDFDEFGIKLLQDEEKEVKGYQNIKSYIVNKKYAFVVLNNKDILILNTSNKVTEEINIIKGNLENRVKTKPFIKVVWKYIAIIVLLVTTLFYGAKIYKSGIKYNGKLSWVLQDLENKKTVKFQHNNIYGDGVEGIFQDIKKKINMPEELYVATSFSLNFEPDGNITSFDTLVYGKNDKDEVKSFLISYDVKKSDKIIIYLNGYVNADYNEDKLLEPLLKTVKVMQIKDSILYWNEKEYGILYYGKRSFGNTDGIMNVDSEGNDRAVSSSNSEMIGYFVSLFVPGKENEYPPYRYNLVDNLDKPKIAEPLKEKENKNTSEKTNNGVDEFYLSGDVGYRLEVTDAAMGKRAYSLNKTADGGKSWGVINFDPFAGELGVAAGVTFLNDKLGFLCLSHSGGAMAVLYRTEDGGATFKKVDIPEVKVSLNSGESYNPFDFPGMPSKKDGVLNILIGQGSDGDHNGGCKAIYESKDSGKTWSYIREAARE